MTGDDALVSVTESAGLSAVPMDTAIQLLDAGHSARSILGVVVQVLDQTDRLEVLAVRRARAEGMTWRQIGDLLGVSAQAAHKRFAGKM
jgi:hypothetical protein